MKEVSVTKCLCTNCEEVATFKRVIKEEFFSVKGDEIKVHAEYCKCDNCGNKLDIEFKTLILGSKSKGKK